MSEDQEAAYKRGLEDSAKICEALASECRNRMPAAAAALGLAAKAIRECEPGFIDEHTEVRLHEAVKWNG